MKPGGAMPDFTRMKESELRTFLETCRRTGQREKELAILREMQRRGIAKRRDFSTLSWNQERVALRMEPFKKVASAVQGNRRTPYTEAGGRKIGRSKGDPEKMWIDTYCAIKTKNLNAVLVCYIQSPGDEPKFHLYIDGGPLAAKSRKTNSYNADQLGDALVEWRRVAELA
jgi:hypothetical protein